DLDSCVGLALDFHDGQRRGDAGLELDADVLLGQAGLRLPLCRQLNVALCPGAGERLWGPLVVPPPGPVSRRDRLGREEQLGLGLAADSDLAAELALDSLQVELVLPGDLGPDAGLRFEVVFELAGPRICDALPWLERHTGQRIELDHAFGLLE